MRKLTSQLIKEFQKQFKDYFIITVGLFIVAVEIHLFMIPNGFVAGGVSGLAIVIANAFKGMPESYHVLKTFMNVGNIMLILNVILFIIGFIFIGSKFGIRTIYSSLALSLMVTLLGMIYPIQEGKPLMDDKTVQLFVASVMSALGLAIAFRYNASTGGTDITGKIINKYFHVDLGKAVLFSDLLITLTAFSINGFTSFIYGIIGVFINGIMIDYILQKFNASKEIVIISDKCDDIKNYIIFVLEKGATIYDARGAYTNEEKEIIRTVVNKREFIKLKEFIKSVDINAFITVNDIHQTFGLGFIAITD